MKTIDLIKAGVLRTHFTLGRLVSISCLLALLAFPGGSFAASRIANLSTRANVGTGNNNVILGTILVGSGSATLVFRGMGPSLAPYIPGTLANPYLQILNSSGASIGANNNWQDDPGQAAAIQAAGLAPGNPNEAAIRMVLGPGAYSAVLTGVGGGTGIGLVEVYDITSQPSSIQLGNVSTRANAGTGNNTEVFGLIIQGGNKSLGLRGIGPSLAPYFPGTLANPALSLRTSGGTQLQYNQNWKDNQHQQYLISSYGLAPSNDLESAMITGNLNGTYTVVMDTSGGSGITLLEAYDLGEQIATGGGGGAHVCSQYPNQTLAQSAPFTLPANTPLTLRFGGHASHASCPQCYQPGGPGCGGPSWGINAVLADSNDNIAGGFLFGIGGGGQCHVISTTTTGTVNLGFLPPYRLRLRGSSSSSCQSGTSSLTVDYYVLNGP